MAIHASTLLVAALLVLGLFGFAFVAAWTGGLFSANVRILCRLF